MSTKDKEAFPPLVLEDLISDINKDNHQELLAFKERVGQEHGSHEKDW